MSVVYGYNFPNEQTPAEPPLPVVPPVLPKHHGGIAAAIVIIALLALAGATAGYYYWWLPQQEPSPEIVVEKMSEALAGVNTLAYSAVANITTGDATANLTASGVADKGATGEGKFTLAMDFNPRSLEQNTSTSTPLSFDQFPLGFEFRVVGSDAYIKVGRAPGLLGFVSLDRLLNKWVKIDGMIKSQVRDNSDLTPQEQAELWAVVKMHKIIKILETLPVEDLAGVPTYHYRFGFDKAAIEALLVDLMAMIKDLAEERGYADYPQDIKETLDKMVLPEGEIWIGREDFLPYRLILTDTLSTQGQAGQYTITLNFSNYNQSVEVTVPTESVPLEQLLGQFFGPISSSTVPTPSHR